MRVLIASSLPETIREAVRWGAVGAQMDFQDFNDAWEASSGNPFRLFHKRPGHTTSGYERSVGRDFPHLALSPKFAIFPTDKIFTIGSCFSRNIEPLLQQKGFDVITSKCIIPFEFYELSGFGARNGALNVYTPHSMRDMLQIVDRDDAQKAAILIDGNDHIDMIASGLRPLNTEESRIVRDRILDTYNRLSEADVVMITLGYTESWFDTIDGMFVSKSPAGSRRTMRHADRYKFANATADQTASALREIIDTIMKRTNGEARIILTVSPVPLHGTFTNRDVVSANLYSKATLLSTAITISSEYSNVDYFPSYELVTMSQPDHVWAEDGLHIETPMIEKVMDVFSSTYLAA